MRSEAEDVIKSPSQTDGASEVMNRMVENYLRCYCSYHENDWDDLLSSAELAYNSAISDDLGMSPFEVDLGWNPKAPIDILARNDCHVETVTEFKSRLNESLNDAKFSYQVSKARQSAQRGKSYNLIHTKSVTGFGSTRRFSGMHIRSLKSLNKLSTKRFGPFFVNKLVGKNAVKVELPSHFKVHYVVHVVHIPPYHEQPSDISAPVVEKLHGVSGIF